jgi:hypothetical protein
VGRLAGAADLGSRPAFVLEVHPRDARAVEVPARDLPHARGGWIGRLAGPLVGCGSRTCSTRGETIVV